MSVHQSQELSSLMIEGNRVRCGLKADRVVVAVLIGLEAAATVVLWFLRGLSVIQAIRLAKQGFVSKLSRSLIIFPYSIMPDVHRCAFQWLAIMTVNVSKQMRVRRAFF